MPVWSCCRGSRRARSSPRRGDPAPPGSRRSARSRSSSCAAPSGPPPRRTGDLVRDNGDGTYTFVGREKEVIRRRGENLSPAEVEEALMAHEDVVEAAVIGVPSELGEDEVKAFVVLADADGAELGAIRAFAAERLTRFKVPRFVEA